MKPADVFGIVVRAIGLVVCLKAGGTLVGALLSWALGAAILGVPMLAVGLWLLRGAPTVVSFAFPEAQRLDAD